MNRLSIERRARAIRALVEGSSVRAVGRATGCDKDTVLRLLVEAGEFCSIYQDHVLRNLPCKRIEADEIWAFVGAKQSHAKREGDGDLWTFVALCADSKLAVTWLVGPRSAASTRAFMADLAPRLAHRVQLSTDNWWCYPPAVRAAFGRWGCDYATITKRYGADEGPHRGRYSPSPVVVDVQKVPVLGSPKVELVSTSYVERNNLSMRMGMRRFTRLTNGFSRKAENHAHAVSLHFMHYNFCRKHTTLTRRHKGAHWTPAMEAGITDHVWTWEEILGLMEPTIMLGAA